VSIGMQSGPRIGIQKGPNISFELNLARRLACHSANTIATTFDPQDFRHGFSCRLTSFKPPWLSQTKSRSSRTFCNQTPSVRRTFGSAGSGFVSALLLGDETDWDSTEI
jgi:hypothetical protein